MNKANVGRRCVGARTSRGLAMIESLESRQLLSAAPITVSAASPGKILAGTTTGKVTVTVRNLTATPVTEDVTITLAPSLDGTTPAGTYDSPSITESLTLKKHGAAHIKVPFTLPATTLLFNGKYRTIATVELDANIITVTAPGAFKLTVPPAPTTSPSLVGHYFGLIAADSGTSGGGHISHQASFDWMTTSQTLDSLTGTFGVGDQQTTGTMTGSENTGGTIQFTLASANINYTLTGTVSADGTLISGKILGTFVNNIFAKLKGRFHLALQPT